jgi:DNA primase
MVSYKEVKEKITIEQVLKKYGVQYSKKGKQFAATCPFCANKGFIPFDISCFTIVDL